MAPGGPGPVLRRLFRLPVWLYERRLGWLLGRRFLMLTHVGRRSGREYRTVVEVIGHDMATEEWYVLAGYGHRADWYRNVLANPAVVSVARCRFRATARELAEDEALRVLAGYEHRNRLAAPALRWMLSRLLGSRYTGSDADRRRLVAQLPIVGLRPATAGTAADDRRPSR